MAKRPEGLSPNFNSIVSPDVPSSLIFSWTFIKENSGDYQKDAEVKVYKTGSNTALITFHTGTDQQADITSHQGVLDLEQTYEWEVKVTAANDSTAFSGRKRFKFGPVFLQDGLVWRDGPDAYEYIGTRQYFEEIRENAISVLRDYVVDSIEENDALKKALALFTLETVPSRTDFENLESILWLIAKKEDTYRDEIQRLIEDGLGAQDIHKIYAIFDRLIRMPPKEPSNVYLTFGGFEKLYVKSGRAYNNGKEDLSVDVNWQPSDLKPGTCTINFLNELSEDVSYYKVELEVGFTDKSCTHTLFYRVEDVESFGRKINVPMDHINFVHLSSSKETRYVLRVSAVDKRKEESVSYYRPYKVDNVPLGVASYNLRVQQYDLSNQWITQYYYDIYNGPNTAYVHNVTGNVDGVYHYAVRVFDINGNVSDWFWILDYIKIDPLKPPAAPKPRMAWSSQHELNFIWDAVPTAEYYEYLPTWWQNPSIQRTNTLDSPHVWLNPDTTYVEKVRAVNRAGASPWATVSGKTQPRPIIEKVQKNVGSRTWRTNYVILMQNGRVIKNPAEWRYEYDDREVFHGEWIELRDKNQDGLDVRKGTRWGNNKCLFFLDHNDWRQKLQGKEILDVQFYIRRRNTGHGYKDDGRFLHVWAHNYAGKWDLPPASQKIELNNHQKIERIDFNQGEAHWISLNKSFGEGLRDGWIKGIAFYHPEAEYGPYSYMRFDAYTFQFYVKYR